MLSHSLSGSSPRDTWPQCEQGGGLQAASGLSVNYTHSRRRSEWYIFLATSYNQPNLKPEHHEWQISTHSKSLLVLVKDREKKVIKRQPPQPSSSREGYSLEFQKNIFKENFLFLKGTLILSSNLAVISEKVFPTCIFNRGLISRKYISKNEQTKHPQATSRKIYKTLE